MSCGISHLFGERLVSPELADFVVCFDVGHRIGAGRLADGILIDKLHIAQIAQVAFDGHKFSRTLAAFVQFAFQRAVKNVAYQCALSRTANTRHYRHHIKWEAGVHTFQVVFTGTFYFDIVVPWTTVFRHGNGLFAQQVFHRITVAAFL